MIERVQLTDVTCIDLLGNISTDYIDVCANEVDEAMGAMRPLATDIKFHYLSSTLEPATMTPDMKILPTVTYDDAPRDLDILVIGGPPISHRPAASIRFLKEASEKTKVIMTTCIGSMWLAAAGVLDGKQATTNRGFLGMAKKIRPQVNWQDQRWVVDDSGKFKHWTSGGAAAGKSIVLGNFRKGVNSVRGLTPWRCRTSGIDMVATYVMESFNEKIARFSLDGLDVDPTARGQFYKG